MNPTHPDCENVQQEISFALDDQCPIPASALEHARDCQDCGAFLSAWTGELHETLSAPLSPAGPGLRESVLSIPKTPATKRLSQATSAIAAALLLGFLGYLLIEIRPSRTQSKSEQGPAVREIVALKADFRKGLGALRGPSNAMQHVLNR